MSVPIGLHLTSFDFPGVPERDRLRHGVALAVAAEDVGFDALWVNDHLIDGAAGTWRPETYVFLALVAAHTTRIRVGALASSVYFRSPRLLARTVESLHDASGGRAVLGIGAGHPRTEGEHRAFGFDFPPLRERIDHLEAVLPEIRRELGDRIPILVAGSGEHRLLRIVARHADMCNFSQPSGDTLDMLRHRLGVLAAHCAAVGRDYGTITKTYKAMVRVGGPEADHRGGWLSGNAESIRHGAQAFIDAGIDELIVQIEGLDSPGALAGAAEALAGLRVPASSEANRR